ncbi:ABC transporter permease [uncultured Paludibaculum sp.]|uniref:ABC transporter permease n=1 Tax=uncultured Paludibaculum sp. TaxID=1765020 RepID=UPI002AAB4A89|nr:ABC transporter permease [uncultured Paludibaculum sp.]
MLLARDTMGLSLDALRSHRLRSALTVLGLTMGVATLITVVTIVQGANVYVETKIANLGADVFQMARTPFAVTDYEIVLKALRYKKIHMEDYDYVRSACPDCKVMGASGSVQTRANYRTEELTDVNMNGQTASMAEIEARTIEMGRYFTEIEDQRAVRVAVIGATIRDKFFPEQDPVGRVFRLGSEEFTVVGLYERGGSVLGQDSDNFVVIPLNTFLQLKGSRYSLTINVKVPNDPKGFERAQDQARLALRARRHIRPTQDEDFFIGTKDSYIQLWQQISGAFFAVFILVSSISAVVGGIVIMNVMLVSVTERTKEIGIRRAMGATGRDILKQFLTESVLQCMVGGFFGISLGFLCAEMLNRFTSFPASVQGGVAVLGMVLSSAIGLFFGIYPASRAARLDPVEALRAE